MSENEQTIKAELATLQQRIIAGIIDWAIMFVSILVLELLASIPSWIATALLTKAAANPLSPNYTAWVNTAATLGIISGIVYAVISLFAAFIAFFYFVIYQRNKGGQTIGKKQQGIKVVIIEDPDAGTVRDVAKEDLMPLFLRWLLMIVDGIFAGAVGLFLIYNSPDNQRLGDQIAKTAVVVAPKEA